MATAITLYAITAYKCGSAGRNCRGSRRRGWQRARDPPEIDRHRQMMRTRFPPSARSVLQCENQAPGCCTIRVRPTWRYSHCKTIRHIRASSLWRKLGGRNEGPFLRGLMRAASTAATTKRAGRAARDLVSSSTWGYPTLARWLAEASLTFYLTAAVLVASLVLGGGDAAFSLMLSSSCSRFQSCSIFFGGFAPGAYRSS